MTDKEIIKALERMSEEDAEGFSSDVLVLINRQQAEIENARAEAIRDFAEAFDDILAGMRDEYAHFGRPEYGLVCEVVHAKLSNCVKKVVGKKYEY